MTKIFHSPSDKPVTRPFPGGEVRKLEADERRHEAALLAGGFGPLSVAANGEEEDYGFQPVISFSKGLKHDPEGLVEPEDYKEFVTALNTQDGAFNIQGDGARRRGWESPLAGHYYDLQGADMAGVAMAPAPKLGSSELSAEMAEVYVMALIRDLPLHDWDKPDTETSCKDPDGKAVTMQDLLDELNRLAWFDKDADVSSSTYMDANKLTPHEQNRRQARWDENDKLTLKTLFRGSAPGSDKGPYLSQFMLMGTGGRQGASRPGDGYIQFGAQTVDQRLDNNTPSLDFMTTWEDWLRIQKGARPEDPSDFFTGKRDFVHTGRDLATYVHYDQLYQAYFNACLIMLTNKVPFDASFPDQIGTPREPFAAFGGPHVLSLMTEVASRALKAVRRQKFQVHRRARPEVLAARLTQVANGHTGKMHAKAKTLLHEMLKELGIENLDPETGWVKDPKKPGLLLACVAQHNGKINTARERSETVLKEGLNFLLPMAFVEGSPMHAAYGAGHATVAGACVTMLKAFFETEPDGSMQKALSSKDFPVTQYHCANGEGHLVSTGVELGKASISEELDKLAANISIGRNVAGVHYYTDYFDSLRMGERVAAQMIADQMLTYNEQVSMSFRCFDGDLVKISTDGGSSSSSVTWDITNKGQTVDPTEWWLRHVAHHVDDTIDQVNATYG
ncbi:MAG: bromoperoxidase [Pseudomonadota bacterium]